MVNPFRSKIFRARLRNAEQKFGTAQKSGTCYKIDGTELKIGCQTKFSFRNFVPNFAWMARKSGTRSKINGTEGTAFPKFQNETHHWLISQEIPGANTSPSQ